MKNPTLSLWLYGRKFNGLYGLGRFQGVTHISPSVLTLTPSHCHKDCLFVLPPKSVSNAHVCRFAFESLKTSLSPTNINFQNPQLCQFGECTANGLTRVPDGDTPLHYCIWWARLPRSALNQFQQPLS